MILNLKIHVLNSSVTNVVYKYLPCAKLYVSDGIWRSITNTTVTTISHDYKNPRELAHIISTGFLCLDKEEGISSIITINSRSKWVSLTSYKQRSEIKYKSMWNDSEQRFEELFDKMDSICTSSLIKAIKEMDRSMLNIIGVFNS